MNPVQEMTSNVTMTCIPLESDTSLRGRLIAMVASVSSPLAGSIIGAFLFSLLQIILQRLVPYLRSGVIVQAFRRIFTDRSNPFHELLPEGMPRDMYQTILDISRTLHRACISTKPIAEGFEYVTLAFIYKIRLRLKGEQFSNICVIVQDSNNLGIHEFHHKVMVEMKRDIDMINSRIASKLAEWISSGRVINYSCGEKMLYVLNTGSIELVDGRSLKNRQVIIEVIANPISDQIHQANARRYITGGVGNYSYHESPIG